MYIEDLQTFNIYIYIYIYIARLSDFAFHEFQIFDVRSNLRYVKT
jgi:hypothetical protein